MSYLRSFFKWLSRKIRIPKAVDTAPLPTTSGIADTSYYHSFDLDVSNGADYGIVAASGSLSTPVRLEVVGAFVPGVNFDPTPALPVEEFSCNTKVGVPPELMENAQKLAQCLQVIRAELNSEVYVKSGYRTVKYNHNIGGKDDSQHIHAKAADIYVKGLTSQELAARLKELVAAGKIQVSEVKASPTYVHFSVA